MKTTTRAAVAAIAIIAPLLFVTGPSEAAAPYFASCDALTNKWPNGVARGPVAANKAVRDGYSRPAYGPRRQGGLLGERDADLDRDKDGTACEN